MRSPVNHDARPPDEQTKLVALVAIVAIVVLVVVALVTMATTARAVSLPVMGLALYVGQRRRRVP